MANKRPSAVPKAPDVEIVRARSLPRSSKAPTVERTAPIAKLRHLPLPEAELPDRLQAFVKRWREYAGTEQAGAQPFLQGLLDVYGAVYPPGTIFEQHPVRSVRTGPRQGAFFGVDKPPTYTTERMDMYLPKVCVWEMKKPREKLERHYEQILRYWKRTQTPRYMVLCNFDEFWIYDTNEEDGEEAPKLRFFLSDLPGRGDALLFLRGEKADLEQRSERVTAEVAGMLGKLVRDRAPGDRDRIAKVVLECVWAMFAEDTDLVPAALFTETMHEATRAGTMAPAWSLFQDFSKQDLSERRNPFAPYVNGPLFDRHRPKITLTGDEIRVIYEAARDFDWQGVRPEIFGSIFEQAYDLTQRHDCGLHFTREADIMRVVGPAVIEPWRQRIRSIRTPKDAEHVVEQMKGFHVLDPACGCGNFLYIVYREMKRLEAALVNNWIAVHGKGKAGARRPPRRPYFTLNQIHGIEINQFAAFLTRVVLWVGEHLAKRELGLDEETLPLKNLEANIREADALLTDWPRPAGELAIVGNPPYLGVRHMRRNLTDAYVDKLFAHFPENRAADLVTYWFTRALVTLREGERAGFVCTNSTAQNDSREASIDRIIGMGGTITDAWKSYPWPGEAAVHISIVNWIMDDYDGVKKLNDVEVTSIAPTLTATGDVTSAVGLHQNQKLCFMGVTPGNHGFVLSHEERAAIIAADPGSAEVIKPYLIGRDVNRDIRQRPTRWIIDFSTMNRDEAQVYIGAFRHVQRHVYTTKRAEADRKTDAEKKRWWQFVRPRMDMRDSLKMMKYALVMPAVTPHLIVSRQSTANCFDHKLMVVALNDYYHFGVLQSRFHEVWARACGSTLKADLAYTITTIFETFPFPLHENGGYDPRRRPAGEKADRVAVAAEDFDRIRSEMCKARGLGLTKIHNELKAGTLRDLGRAYDVLNDAVASCYGFPRGSWKNDKEILRRLMELNQRIAEPLSYGV